MMTASFAPAATILLLTLRVSSAFMFEGCFADVNEDAGYSFYIPESNLNADCASFCSLSGSILAATKGDICHCTNLQPTKEQTLQSPFDVEKDGDTECTTFCPGARHTAAGEPCEGDVCCGNEDTNAFTFYSVGGVNVIDVVKRRVKRAIYSGKLNWLDAPHFRECHDFVKFETHNGYATLAMTENESIVNSIRSLEECKEICNRKLQHCLSIAYTPKSNTCMLSRSPTYIVELVPSEQYTNIFTKICSTTVYMRPTHFELAMVNTKMTQAKGSVEQEEPLDNLDFEFDLTKSNEADTLQRSFETAVTQTDTLSTASGFDLTSSTSNTMSSTTSVSSDSESSMTRDSSQSVSVSMSVTASASVSVFGFEASASAGVSSNTGFTQASSDSTSNSQSKTEANTESQSTEESTSRSFNKDFSETKSTTKSNSMSFSLNVPPLHKGAISFSKREETNVIKIRSTYQLNGYVNFMVNNVNRTVHVSRVLSGADRVFATLSTFKMRRAVIKATQTIRDRDGTLISSEEQIPY